MRNNWLLVILIIGCLQWCSQGADSLSLRGSENNAKDRKNHEKPDIIGERSSSEQKIFEDVAYKLLKSVRQLNNKKTSNGSSGPKSDTTNKSDKKASSNSSKLKQENMTPKPTSAPTWEDLVEDKGDSEDETSVEEAAVPTEAPTETDAPHSPSEEPTEAAVPTEAPTETDAPHSPSEEPTEAAVPTELPGSDLPNKVKTPQQGVPTPHPTLAPHKAPVSTDDDNSKQSENENNSLEEEEEADQLEMAKNLGVLVVVLLLIYYIYTVLRSFCLWCFSFFGEPENGSSAVLERTSQYTPVSQSGDLIDDSGHGYEMSPIHVSNDTIGSLQASRNNTSNGGWGDDDDDDDLNAAIALSLSESQKQSTRPKESHSSPSHNAVSATMQAALEEDGDDDWDDDFDVDMHSTNSSSSQPVHSLSSSYTTQSKDQQQPVVPIRDTACDDNILGAVMSGSEYALPARNNKQSSIGQGGSGRFKTQQSATPGTTSAAGVKVVKGLSLKDAFAKKK